MKWRELLQIYASFGEKRLSAEWIGAATRQVEGKKVTQLSAVVADHWLFPSTESQISFLNFSLLLLPAPSIFIFFFCVSDCFAHCTEKRTQFLREEGIMWQDEPA